MDELSYLLLQSIFQLETPLRAWQRSGKTLSEWERERTALYGPRVWVRTQTLTYQLATIWSIEKTGHTLTEEPTSVATKYRLGDHMYTTYTTSPPLISNCQLHATII